MTSIAFRKYWLAVEYCETLSQLRDGRDKLQERTHYLHSKDSTKDKGEKIAGKVQKKIGDIEKVFEK